MHDPRIDKLAHVLVHYATAVKSGQLVRISGSLLSAPLVIALYQEVLQAGAHPIIRLTSDTCQELFLRHADDLQMDFVDPLALHETETLDCTINIWADENTKALSGIHPDRQARVSNARKPILETFLQRSANQELRWVGTQFPTQASAQDAEMSLHDYEHFVFTAGLLHLDNPAAAWREIHEKQQKVCDFLNDAHEIRFTTPQGTDLKLGIEGRRWINCIGHENFPDGEVFTGPVETATEGVVHYSFPAVHGGREVSEIRLEFREGKVVNASAEKGEPFLLKMIDQDAGASCLGEIAIGTNYSITQYTKNTLFDEKIGGTFHAALGAAYPESGGENQSALHWDMVCDLRKGGLIEVDGRVISENGVFVDGSWPQP